MSFANPIRILVLHDDPFTRAGLAATFSKYPDLEVVNIDEVFAGDEDLPPARLYRTADVVVADYENGIRLAERGSRRSIGSQCLKIMIVASTDREWEIRHAMECGIRGYILFGCALDELASGVRAVNTGVRHLSAQVAQRLAESLSADPLTSREEEVLRLVVDGLGNKSIAKRLDIAVGTVKSHLKGIFDKLNVDSRTQAICAAERRGLLSTTTKSKELAQDTNDAHHASPPAHASRSEAMLEQSETVGA
jgi:two-component system NarL family response regulator